MNHKERKTTAGAGWRLCVSYLWRPLGPPLLFNCAGVWHPMAAGAAGVQPGHGLVARVIRRRSLWTGNRADASYFDAM